MTTPRVETDSPPPQTRHLAPDQGLLVSEWWTPERDRMRLYRDGNVAELIMHGAYGPERAATITAARGDQPHLEWEGQAAAHAREWRNAQAAIVRARLAGAA